jgi:hypothetical protein
MKVRNEREKNHIIDDSMVIVVPCGVLMMFAIPLSPVLNIRQFMPSQN